MKKRTKLTTALLLAMAVNSSYATERCFPPVGEIPTLPEVLECFQNTVDKQQQLIEKLTAENQAQQDEIQALQKQLVAQKKELDERLTLMSIGRDESTVITFVDAKGSKHTLNLGEGKKALQNEWISYRPGNNEKTEDAILYFNLTGSPSFVCTLLHDEDDRARLGFYFATDTNDNSIWGKTQASFILSRKGVTSYVIDIWAAYSILCVK